ncbi:hypothetical protein JQC67_00770 [Aurantibacter crassamenti]|uniref:hypothetical protein n=1 Tax=Aurantibacter crassamenti TaxID=1837375 RepID=UPI00193A357C|nr:hypothetical protein [Aurantibacter crassamenti]MBM1104657.1 hypothetical protein [Aurantibacter crassamenti]
MRQQLHILLPFLFLMSLSLSAQDSVQTKQLFVRVFDTKKTKIAKGKLQYIDKDSIVVLRYEKRTAIPVNRIGIIKTKRSVGHNVGIGFLAGGTIGFIYGLAQGSEGGILDSAGENGLAFGTLGILAGPIVGGLTGLVKRPKSFRINHKPEELLKFKKSISEKYQY